MAAGSILVPIDDLWDTAQLEVVLRCSGARAILTSENHLAAAGEWLQAKGIAASLVDAPLGSDDEPALGHAGWEDLPVPDAEDAAILSWTSGTTGTPKGFHLSYRNIGSNVSALCQLQIVNQDDRVLLPLPLHHVYPFVVGMLTPLAIGAAVVLPVDATGPVIAQVLRTGDITIVVGVPRLYEAITGAIEARAAGHGRALIILWRLLMRLAIWMQRSIGVRPGVVLFAGIRRAIAPRLRYLVSGGARLATETSERLEALGWTVLSGYGLGETASLFTGNPPGDRCLASAGKPLADGEIRIASPDQEGVGEVELRGTSITTGYVNDPEANQSSFTPDGWFRTGDLGFVDRRGFLHVTGRSKEILVLGGGKKVNPEELEEHYAKAPQIREMAILEHEGRLVGLVQPDPVKVREMGTISLRDGIRVALAEWSQGLPEYQRLYGFALTDQPLPQTRLGKFRRFMLPELYRQALAGVPRREARPLAPEDQALLEHPAAHAVWMLLQERYPEQTLDLDMNLGLELNVDSFAWMELTITLQDRVAIQLSEVDIAAIDTIRDLLRCCAEKAGEPVVETSAGRAMEDELSYWLAPTSALVELFGVFLYAINWVVVRVLFRLRVRGVENLPPSGAFVIAPNHASYLDPFVIAAAMPLALIRRAYWAGSVTLLFVTKLQRLFSRVGHVFPVDERRPDKAIAAAVQLLQAGHPVVWFAEGWRSPDGELQRFLPGIGEVLLRSGATAIPTYVRGAFAAWPRGRRLPRGSRIAVEFGQCERAASLRLTGEGHSEEERVAQALRERVLALSPAG
jgi:long-chain acyl-CoA synthetase